MLLYIHVPFCRSRCAYCSFYSSALSRGDEGRIQKYQDTLIAEIALWADRLGKERVETVFFGGGTPSLLSASAVALILTRIDRAFSLAGNAEISFEANPESFIASGYARDLRAAGITRLSLGVQSLNDAFLQRMGRVHSAKEAALAMQRARQAHFSSISVDCMWGLPGQKPDDWKRELKELSSLQPDHFSCYGLTLEETTPLAEAVRGGLALPSEQDQAAMYLEGIAYLESLGYLQYEISNFARKGFRCRHNLGYWQGREYLGLGPSAVSTIQNRRWSNIPDLAAWSEAVHNRALPEDIEELDRKARVLEYIMLRLRTTRGLSVKAYRKLTGRNFLKDNHIFLQALHNEDLIRIRGGFIQLTHTGMLVSNAIVARLFEAVEERLSDTEREKKVPA